MFRQGTARDSARIFEVMARAFKIDEENPKYASRKKEAEASPEQFRVLELDGEVVSIVRILRHPMKVGRSIILKGDVGEVSTDPAFQGRGLMTELMNDCVRWMRDQGYHVSRLGGLVHFYSRFGYTPFPRRTIEFPLTPVRGGGRVQAPKDVLAPLDASPGIVRHYRPETDGPWRSWLSWQFNKDRTGASASESETEPPEPKPIAPSEPESPEQLMTDPMEFVYERDGRIHGFISAHENPEFEKYLQAKVEIGSAAFDLSEPKVAGVLVNHVLHIALERGADHVTSRLPFDPEVYDSLIAGKVRFQTVELHAAFASNMIRIVNLRGLIESILPELRARLRASGFAGWQGALSIAVDVECAGIGIGDGRIEMDERAVPKAQIGFSQGGMMRLLLGMCSAREMIPETDPKLLTLLGILFPHQPTASGLWG